MTNQHPSTNTTPLMLTKNFAQLKSEVQKHIAADQVIQGEYWEDNKGCFIRCLAHSHKVEYLETEYGIPLMLTKIAEVIFERLPDGKHVKFFGDFPDAVATDNKDLSLVSWKFLKAILEELPEQTPGVKTVIEGISKLAAGGSWGREAARAAARGASRDATLVAGWAAKRGACVVDYVAAWTAKAAARNAGWASDAANAAADAAADAAVADAVSAERQSEILLQLIKEAPVAQQEAIR